jgi:hypothetical protein
MFATGARCCAAGFFALVQLDGSSPARATSTAVNIFASHIIPPKKQLSGHSCLELQAGKIRPMIRPNFAGVSQIGKIVSAIWM